MTNIDEARKRLDAGLDNDGWCFCVSPGGQAFADVRTVLDALDAAERERGEALAALDRIRRLHVKRERPSLLDCSCGPALTPCATRLMLRTVPADVLRERDAEKWVEGFSSGFKEATAGPLDDFSKNPYRETKEQSDDHR